MRCTNLKFYLDIESKQNNENDIHIIDILKIK